MLEVHMYLSYLRQNCSVEMSVLWNNGAVEMEGSLCLNDFRSLHWCLSQACVAWWPRWADVRNTPCIQEDTTLWGSKHINHIKWSMRQTSNPPIKAWPLQINWNNPINNNPVTENGQMNLLLWSLKREHQIQC